MTHHKTMAEFTSAELHQLRNQKTKLTGTTQKHIPILCEFCQFTKTLCKGEICKQIPWKPYLPKHLIEEFIGLSFTPSKVFLYNKNRKIRFLFHIRSSISFNLNQFYSGQELRQALGVAVWKNPTVHRNLFRFAATQTERWEPETKLVEYYKEEYKKYLAKKDSSFAGTDFPESKD